MNPKAIGAAFALGSAIFMAGRLSAPQTIPAGVTLYAIADSPNGTPYLVPLGAPVADTPAPTFPSAATVSPTPIVPLTPSQVTPALPTVTAIPLPACAGYPCDYPADRIYTVLRAVTLRDAPSTSGAGLRVWDAGQRIYGQCVREVTKGGSQWLSEMVCGATYTTWTAIRHNGITYLELFIKE